MDENKLPVPEGLENALDNMLKIQMLQDVQVDMTLQYLNMRRCHLYWMGRQWLRPVVDNGTVVDYAELPLYNTAAGVQPGQPELARGKYDMIMNYVRGDGNKFCAVVGAKSPNPKCQALDATSAEAETRARLADRLLVALRLMWNVEEIHRQLCLSAWKDGTFFLYTPWESDPEKYGTLRREIVEMVERTSVIWACQSCGNQVAQDPEAPPPQCGCSQSNMVPTDTLIGQEERRREERYPGAAPGCYAKSFYDVALPFYVPLLEFNRSPWLVDQGEMPTGEVLEQWGSILQDKIGEAVDTLIMPDDTVSQLGYWSRNLRANVNSDQRLNGRFRQTVSRIWLRPSQYNMFGNKTITTPTGQVKIRDWMRSAFPYGAKITRVGRWVVDIEPEALGDHWSIGTPMVSATVGCDPIVYDFLQVQDAINSADNLFLESMERNIPQTLVDANKLNVDAMSKRQGVPGELVPVELLSGESLKEVAYNLPMPQVDGQQFGFRNQTLEAGREITGVQRSIFGAGNYSTAHEAELAKTQAMMQLSLAWKGLQACWKGAYTNGLKMLARYGADVLVKWGLNPKDVQLATTLVDESGNLNGIEVRVDEGIPATWGQIHDTLTYLVQQGPPSWQLTGLGHPSNANRLQDGLGIPDWVTPGSGAKDYVMKTIRRLLTGRLTPQINPDGSPVVGPDGMPVPPQPSEMIDQMILPPGLALPIFQEWFQSSDGIAASEENPEGFANLHAAVMIWAAPPPMPMNGDQGSDQGGPGPGPEPGQGHPPGPNGPPEPRSEVQNMGKGQ